MKAELLANGIHLDMHWFVQRLEEGTLLITFSGYVEGTLAFNQVERASATKAEVKALIEAEIAAVRARLAKRRTTRTSLGAAA